MTAFLMILIRVCAFSFMGITPDTDEHQALYAQMCPIGHVRADVPPLLICDGEKKEIPSCPACTARRSTKKLKAVGADVTYWMTAGGGHDYPRGSGFDTVLKLLFEPDTVT